MHVTMLLRSELRRSAGVLLCMAAVLALSLALAAASGICERMIRQSSAAAAHDFDLLAGARGSATSLLLGAVYLRDEPLPLMPTSALEELLRAKGVRWAAPVAFGDRIGEAPLVGTTRAMATLGGERALASGRVFASPHEAVAGAASGLALGEDFTPMHGRTQGAGHAHAHAAFRVVGILPATGPPWDRAVLVPIESVWAMHGAGSRSGAAGRDERHEHEELEAHGDHAEAPLESWLSEDLSKLPGMSAVVVKPATVADAYRLRQRLNQTAAPGADGAPVPLMGAFTGEVLVSLYATMGSAAAALSGITAASLVASLAATLITGILLGRLRAPTLLQLRLLGAPRAYVGQLVWLIVMTVVAAGAAGGVLGGLGLAELCARVMTDETGIAMSPALSGREGLLALATLAAGALCALVPAVSAGRMRLG